MSGQNSSKATQGSGSTDLKGELEVLLSEVQKLEYLKPDSAIHLAVKGVVLAESIGDTSELGSLLARIGAIYFRKNNYVGAVEFYMKAYPLLKAGSKIGFGFLLIDIGNSYYQQGLFDEAISFYKKSTQAFSEADHSYGLSVANNNLGLCELKNRHFDSAEKYFRQALSVRREMNSKLLLLHSYGYLLDVKTVRKDFSGGEEICRIAFPLLDSLVLESAAEREIPIEFFRKAGLFYFQKEEYNLAIKYLDTALAENSRFLKEDNLTARIYLDLAATYKALHKDDEYVRYLHKSLEYAKKINNLKFIKDAYRSLSAHYAFTKDYLKALKYSNMLLTTIELESGSMVKS